MSPMRAYRYVVCDVFTECALEGNALAVFIDAQGIEPEIMQRLARETNLSETTFVLPAEQGGDARVRIFTPSRELPFAGHPTLGTAFVLSEMNGRSEFRLELGVGIVPVRISSDNGQPSFGWMRQPTPRSEPVVDAADLLSALGVTASALPVVAYDNGPQHVMVALDSARALTDLRPRFQDLAAVTKAGVCAFFQDDDHTSVRYFAPHAGVPEDPATGSAAGPLAVHLLRHGRWRLGDELVIHQGRAMGRPSRLVARVTERDALLEVEVGGAAVVVARGEFLVPQA